MYTSLSGGRSRPLIKRDLELKNDAEDMLSDAEVEWRNGIA